jgi:hypothetical protein
MASPKKPTDPKNLEVRKATLRDVLYTLKAYYNEYRIHPGFTRVKFCDIWNNAIDPEQLRNHLVDERYIDHRSPLISPMHQSKLTRYFEMAYVSVHVIYMYLYI